MLKRQQQKEQIKDDAQRKKLEKSLKKGLNVSKQVFPDLDYSKDGLSDLLDGTAIGRKICHIWCEDNELVPYNGLIKKILPNKMYQVAYWSKSEELDNAVDWDVSMFGLVADLLQSNLEFEF